VEEMFAGDVYGISVDGYIEDVDALNSGSLKEAHEAMLNLPLEIFVTGDVDKSDAEGLFGNMVGQTDLQSVMVEYGRIPKFEVERKARVITEKQDVSQAKLAMGFITGVVAQDSDYDAITMYNAVFGGGPYSKLFNNVREKHSLCYYVGSRVDRFKGVMLVNAGINGADYAKAHAEILKQDEAIKAGNISDEEFMAARLGLINTIRSAKDSLSSMEEFYLRRLLSGETLENSIDEIVSGIEKVMKEEVVRVAQKVRLDTTYFLNSGI
jgi:predicted Zn-dependent peptidase